MNLPINQIICGDSLEVLKTLPDESVNCCISSPPYWALRDYGVDGQLGLEKTFEEYIDKLCTIYDQVKRVLRKDGTCFVNLADTYAGSTQGGGDPSGRCNGGIKQLKKQQDSQKHVKTPLCGLQQKSLSLIPQRFAIEMVNRGWILRNVIIWHKPNPMPSSAKDRFTVDFEQVFFFTKSKKYFFEPQYEDCLTESNAERPRMGQGTQTKYQSKRGFKGKWKDEEAQSSGKRLQHNLINKRKETGQHDPKFHPLGRNKRCVWTIPTQPFPDAHFATYPEKLVEPMIEAGCPKYICAKCGTPRKKVYEKGDLIAQRKQDAQYAKNALNKNLRTVRDKGWNTEGKFCPGMQYQPTFKGYSDCRCRKEFRPGIVLDPFAAAAQRYTWPLN